MYYWATMTTRQHIILRVTTLLAAIALSHPLWAQEYSRYGACVDFRVNSAIIDESYGDNRELAQCVDSLIMVLGDKTKAEIVSVEICGSASPEGPAQRNKELSKARMLALEGYLRREIELPDSVVAYGEPQIAWGQLAELISRDTTHIPHKTTLLSILAQSTLQGYDWMGRPQDGRINAIWALDNGTTWHELSRRYFAKMRNACFVVVVARRNEPESKQETAPIIESIVEIEPETAYELVTLDIETKENRPMPLMNIKINGLEAAALIANIGIELRITPRLSLDIIGHYSPYDYFNYARKIRIMGIQPELRYWWGESLIRGHFIGIHTPIAGFNVQLNDRHRYQDPNHALWGIGISYGYAMPLGKNGKWGVEFTMGLGYMNITYDTYEGCRNGRYLNTRTTNYFGPTRLGIDFSYRIDRKSNSKPLKDHDGTH